MNKQVYDADAYDLRRKQHWRPYKAEEGKAYNMPHWTMDAPHYARTKKMISAFRAEYERKLGVEFKNEGEVYARYILPLLEHAVRELRINGRDAEAVIKMSLPLPKNEWLKKKGKKDGRKNS